MIAPINKIIPLSLVDGLGNRTSIFFQKCNIACAYCHNPETQNLCRLCGKCVEECPAGALHIEDQKMCWDEKSCRQCDHCIDICGYYASPKIRDLSVEEVVEEVKKNVPFIRGITVSGGECMLYPEFLSELFQQIKKIGLTCYIDSNGTIDFAAHPKLMSVCDKVMLDVKAWDNEVYQCLTGGSYEMNEIVKKNLRYLAEYDKIEEIRIVCPETMVDITDDICGIAEAVGEKRNFCLKLIRFRNQGVKGCLKGSRTPTMAQMEQWRKIAENNGFFNTRIV